MEKMQDPLMVRRKTSGGALNYLAACLGYLVSECVYVRACVCVIHFGYNYDGG